MRPNHENDATPSRAEQAGEWCVRISAGSLSATDELAFDAWMHADLANAQACAMALTVWQELHAISDMPEIISQRADALDAMRRANRKRWSRHLSSPWQWSVGIAASLILVVVSSLWLLGSSPQVYATGIGERRALILPDGSRLSLDAKTKVAVLYETGHRELTLLSGRAKFDVAKDSERPFTVTAGDRTVIATGTAFSVELLGKQVHVIVYEGHVAVVRGDPPPLRDLVRVKEHPGTLATSISSGKELIADVEPTMVTQIMQTDVARSLSWEGGQLNFVDEPLASAVERLNRYGASKIVIADSRTAAIQVNGVFNAGDSTAFVEALSEAYPIRVKHDGADLILTTGAQ